MFSFDGMIKIDTFLRGVFRLAYLNLLWTATTVLGLGVFGLGPASYALAKYVDRWFRHGETPSPARAFWAYARERAGQAMFMSWILLAAGAVIAINLLTVTSWIVQLLNIGALVVLAVAGSYVFPVMAATDVTSIPRQFAAALLIGFGSLHWTILGATAVALTSWLLWQFALPLLLLFGVGIPACALGWITRIVFRPLVADPHQLRTIDAPVTDQVA